jgi:hypothetical protein
MPLSSLHRLGAAIALAAVLTGCATTGQPATTSASARLAPVFTEDCNKYLQAAIVAITVPPDTTLGAPLPASVHLAAMSDYNMCLSREATARAQSLTP